MTRRATLLIALLLYAAGCGSDLPTSPSTLWETSGAGTTTVAMPSYVKHVRIVSTYTGTSSHFEVKVGSTQLANELLGTFWGKTQYDATVPTTGGATSIAHSSGGAWSLTEVR